MSKIDQVLLFAFSHQTVIIELIFAIILGIVVMWLFTNIRGESGDTQSGPNIKDIERALKKVLESTDIKVATAQAKDLIKDDDDPMAPLAVGARAPSDPAEVAKLKAEMENKSRKLNEVESALAQAKDELTKAKAAGPVAGATAAGGAAVPGVNTDELQAKIRSLESRLSEYEIIEDDIANLSLYKEENAKLKSEMNKLKGGTGEVLTEPAVVTTSTTVASTPAPSPAPASAPTPPPTNPTADVSAIDSDKLVKEFDNLVARENSLGTLEKTVAPTVEATPVSVPVPAPAAAAVAPEPVASPAPIASPPPSAEGDAGEKLIEEFENFVKGTNT